MKEPVTSPALADPADPETQADAFRKSRNARRTELMEDYVELIANLIERSGEARQTDIARCLGVTQPTVAKMLKRLAEENLVTQRPYRGVFLTEEGQRLAGATHRRHEIVEAFLDHSRRPARNGRDRRRRHRASCLAKDARGVRKISQGQRLTA